MDKKVFTLRDSAIRDRMKCFADGIQLDQEKPIDVIFQLHKKNISQAQRALMWIWHGQWQDHFGDSDKEEHVRFKTKYLLPVLLREQLFPGLDQLLSDADERLRLDGDYRPTRAIHEIISTNALKTHQMREILTSYQQDTAMLGLVFITRGPQYEEAMGARR